MVLYDDFLIIHDPCIPKFHDKYEEIQSVSITESNGLQSMASE